MSGKALFTLTIALPLLALARGNPFLSEPARPSSGLPSGGAVPVVTPVGFVRAVASDFDSAAVESLDPALRPLVAAMHRDAEGQPVFVLRDGRTVRRGSAATNVAAAAWIVEVPAGGGVHDEEAEPTGGRR